MHHIPKTQRLCERHLIVNNTILLLYNRTSVISYWHWLCHLCVLLFKQRRESNLDTQIIIGMNTFRSSSYSTDSSTKSDLGCRDQSDCDCNLQNCFFCSHFLRDPHSASLLDSSYLQYRSFHSDEHGNSSAECTSCSTPASKSFWNSSEIRKWKYNTFIASNYLREWNHSWGYINKWFQNALHFSNILIYEGGVPKISNLFLQAVCKIISILLHYLILACFMFMMLEAVHMYTLVAFVVKKDGLFSRMLNLLIGWGVPAAIVGISVAFQWENYGGEYQWGNKYNTLETLN